MALSNLIRQSRWVIGLAVIGTLVWTAPVLAQGSDTGAMNVRVTDPDGAALPGVMVVVEGPLGTRTGYTGVDGTTRFPGLYPGDYSATFSLDGFKTVIREGLRISFARTTSLDVAMELSSVEETITVTGESPVVDVKSTNVGRLYTDDLIDKAPTASGLWAGVMDHVPGVVVGGIDVGGGESGQQDGFTAYGSVGGQNVYNINGANTTDPDALGASSFYYSIGAFEEVGVSTASHDMENQTPGVVVNMVTKSGSNDWSFSTKIFYEDDSFVSDNVDAELAAEGVEAGEPNVLLRDFDIQGGGPIVRNRAWFFVDYWDFTVEKLIVGQPPDVVDNTDLENWTLSGTWQMNDDHKVSIRYLTDRKFRGNRGTSRSTPPSAGWIQDSFVDIPQLQWQAVLTENTFADVRFSKMDMEFPLEAKDADSPAPDPSCCPLDPTIELNSNTRVVGSEPALEVFFQRDNTSLSGNVSHYMTSENSSHDFKFGADYQRVQSFSPLRYGTRGINTWVRGGVPEFVRFFNTPAKDIFEVKAPNAQTDKGQQAGLYAQDSWTYKNRLTVNAGVRFDWSEGWLPEQQRLESPWPQLGPDFQALTVPRRDVSSWKDIVPRVGFTYDVSGNGQTAIKANFSMYSQTQGVTVADDVNLNGTGFETYFWTDTNGDGVFQFGEHHTLLNRVFPGATQEVDPDLVSPLTREVTGGIEHELMDNFLVSATGIWRDTYNEDSFVNFCPTDSIPDPSICNGQPGIPYGPLAAQLGVPDPYTPIQVTDPGPDGVLGTADDGGPLTIFSQDPSTFGNGFDFRTQAKDRFGFDDSTRSYKGVSFVAHKRWSDNWQVLASWDIGETKFAGGFGEDPRSDFNSREQLSSADRLHNIKVTANYLFAEPIGVNVGMFLRSMSGQAVSRSAVFGSSDGLAQGAEVYLVAGRGQDTIGPKREDHVNILDVRAEKQFTIGRYGVLHAYFDWFNVTNTNTVTSFRTRSGSRWGEINRIVPPRVFRIGGAWDF